MKIQTYKQQHKKAKADYTISHMEIHPNGKHPNPWLYIVDTDGDYHYVKALSMDAWEQIQYDVDYWLNQEYRVENYFETKGEMPY